MDGVRIRSKRPYNVVFFDFTVVGHRALQPVVAAEALPVTTIDPLFPLRDQIRHHTLPEAFICDVARRIFRKSKVGATRE